MDDLQARQLGLQVGDLRRRLIGCRGGVGLSLVKTDGQGRDLSFEVLDARGGGLAGVTFSAQGLNAALV